MKIIPSFQDGGLASLFTTYIPAQIQGAPSGGFSPSSKRLRDDEADEKGRLTEKDFYQMLSKIDGLPNDTAAIVRSLRTTFDTTGLSNSLARSNMAAEYRNALVQISRAKFQKEEFDKVRNLVTKNEGLNEIAITTSGQVVVSDEEGNIHQISAQEFLKNQDKYQKVTNDNLLWIRANDPKYANNNQILQIVSNGIGLEQVDKMIREKISSLGTSETVRSGYSIKADSHIVQGLNVLSELESAQVAGQAGMTLDGMYKNKIITKEQKSQAEAALKYIYNTLPDNAKVLLAVKSGNMIDAKNGALDVIQQRITAGMSSTNSSDSHWEGTLDQVVNGKGKKGDGSSSGDEAKVTPYWNMINQMAGTDAKIILNKGSNGQLEANGTVYGYVTDSKGDSLGTISLRDAIDKGLGGITTDQKSITFGDIPISREMQSNIMYDGSGGAVAILPTTLGPGGVKMVDLDSLDRWQSFTNALNQRGISLNNEQDVANHKQEIMQLLYEHSLEGLVDVYEGGLDYSQLGQFLMLDGQAVARSGNNPFKDSTFVQKFDPSDSELDTLKTTLSTNDKKNNFDIDRNLAWWNNDTIYKGTIYIPITNNQLTALTASGQNPKESVAMQKEYEYQMLNKRLQAQQPNSSLLSI